MRRVAAVLCLLAASFLPVAGAGAAEDPTGDCGLPNSGQIDASDLPEGSDVVECDVVGRAVDLGDIVLTIPAPGEGVSADGEGSDPNVAPPSGAIFIAADGTISYSSEPTTITGTGTSSSATNGCDTDYIGAYKEWEFHGTWNYYVDNEGQPGGSAYTPASTGAAIEKAGATWHNENSPCYAADHSSAGSLNYAGSTTWNGDFKIVNGTSSCATRDGKSEIDTGNLDTAGAGTYVALNCTWWSGETLQESDIRFNTTDEDFTYNPGSASCGSNDYDVLSVMTHETGHTYGLKDKTGATNYYQTMYESSFPCKSWARDLGKSDVRHLREKYPE